MNKEFTLSFSIRDFRKDDIDEKLRVQVYLVMVEGDKKLHKAIWGQPLEDEEVGTRQSYLNVMDAIQFHILNELCPNEKIEPRPK